MNTLIEAYKNSKYEIFETSIIIEIGIINQQLDDLLLKHNSNEWAFITAYNPYSQVLTDEENEIRHSDLKVLTKNYVTYEGHGVGEDITWKPELSLFIIGISKDDALKIGYKFDQNAIVYGKIEFAPELLILNDNLL